MIDPKYIDKLMPLDVKPECWLSWKFKFVDWMSTADVRFVHLLTHAENSMEPIPQQTTELQELQLMLYTVLASYLQEEDLQLLQAVPSQNGFEAWRQLVEDKEPRIAYRRLSMMGDLIRPYLADSVTFLANFLRWEASVREYEKVSGKTFDRELMLAIIATRCPEEMRRHLKLNASAYGADFEKLRQIVLAYCKANKNDVAPMEVGMLEQGKSKGKVGAAPWQWKNSPTQGWTPTYSTKRASSVPTSWNPQEGKGLGFCKFRAKGTCWTHGPQAGKGKEMEKKAKAKAKEHMRKEKENL
jgi:hypothetical protein